MNKWLSNKKQNFKIFYKNSEGTIIPFSVGVILSFLLQFSILTVNSNLCFWVKIIILLMFLTIGFPIPFIMYKTKQSLIKDDFLIDINFKLMKKFSYYILRDHKKLQESENIHIKPCFYREEVDLEIIKYMRSKKFSNRRLSPKERDDLKEILSVNFKSTIEQANDSLPSEQKQQLKEVEKFLKKNYNKQFFLLLAKEGKKTDPDNFDYEAFPDDDDSICFFATFQDIENNNFYDINLHHITHVEYKEQTKVVLYVRHPDNFSEKFLQITTTRKEWFEKRTLEKRNLVWKVSDSLPQF